MTVKLCLEWLGFAAPSRLRAYTCLQGKVVLTESRCLDARLQACYRSLNPEEKKKKKGP